MKLCLVLLVLVAGALAAERYPSKYDDVDVDRILQNNRILTNYIKCMMDEGSCTAEGRELKSKLNTKLFVKNHEPRKHIKKISTSK